MKLGANMWLALEDEKREVLYAILSFKSQFAFCHMPSPDPVMGRVSLCSRRAVDEALPYQRMLDIYEQEVYLYYVIEIWGLLQQNLAYSAWYTPVFNS